jgi:histone acetyltransferase
MEPTSERLTPLERELLHDDQEQSGSLSFRVLTNDGRTESLVGLVDLKNIFGKQLPKMPKEYIARLVLDRQHMSLACCFEEEIVGGITYRPHPTQSFAEVVFCAVSAHHQLHGYGTRIMNQLKEHAKREGITHLLTYADNHAIGYFRKQGYHKQACASGVRFRHAQGFGAFAGCMSPCMSRSHGRTWSLLRFAGHDEA